MHSIKHVNSPTKNCAVVDLGLISYAAAYALQQQVVAARKRGDLPDVLLLCEHPHVITLGRNGKTANLRASDRLLAQMNVDFCETDRGGDITYHGPGQIVGYPILDLTEHRRDVRWYVQLLEEMMIRSSAEFGIVARRVEGRHGLWVDTAGGPGRKASGHWRALKPLGDIAWLRVQCIDGFALLRSDRPLRNSWETSYVVGTSVKSRRLIGRSETETHHAFWRHL